MKRTRFRLLVLLLAPILLASAFVVCGGGKPALAAGFPLAAQNGAADIYVDTVKDSGNHIGISHAANNLAGDVEAVTGVKPARKENAAELSSFAVIAGSIGDSPVIDDLIKSGKLDVSRIKGKWESYTIAAVDDPVPGVVSRGLVIAGSDKRGTIFGIYKISETIGVSPYGFFADSKPIRQKELILSGETIVQGEPSVKYRGIFINDEASTTNWLRTSKPTGSNIVLKNPIASIGFDHEYYTRVFDLILRNYGNYLWPAMWNNAFWTDDPENAELANAYGIVMGTTHQEFMGSSDKEWVWSNQGDWNYRTNKEKMRGFWTKNVRERVKLENVFTIGMRGLEDTAIAPDATDQENAEFLQEVIDDQYAILQEALEYTGDGRDVTDIPKILALYKEVEKFYYQGVEVPLDVTLMFCDDNHGHLRTLPTQKKRNERYAHGGFGMYYHFDYHGDPRSYRWVNIMPLEKMREQMMMAYDYGVDRVWMVNVGDLKFNELPIDYWFKLAYDVDKWGGLDGPKKAYRDFAAKQFGEEFAGDIADILLGSAQINNIRRPENVLYHNFSATYFDEADRLLARYKGLAKRAKEIFASIPDYQKDAYYGTVLYPVEISSNAWELMVNLQKSKLYAELGLTAANDHADKAEECLKFDTHYMHVKWSDEIAGGKYLGYFPHPTKIPYPKDAVRNIYYLGTTTWNHRTEQLSLTGDFAPGRVLFGDAPEGSVMVVMPQPWITPGIPEIPSARSGGIDLHPFTSYGDETRYIDVGNAGLAAFTYSAAASAPWITLGKTSGTVDKMDRIEVGIDWEKVPHRGKVTGNITIEGADAEVVVNVTANAFDSGLLARLPEKTYIETDGYVSILSKNFSKSVSGGAGGNGARWTVLPDYGREMSSIKVHPANTSGVARKPGGDSPYVEYLVYISTPGAVNIVTQWAPTNPLSHGDNDADKLRYGVSFGGDEVRIVDTKLPGFAIANDNVYWTTGVMTAVRTLTLSTPGVCVSKHEVSEAGLYTLRIYMVDDGLTLQKILVGTEATERTDIGDKLVTDVFIGPQHAGGSDPAANPVRTSFIGPPETYFKNGGHDRQSSGGCNAGVNIIGISALAWVAARRR
ncbi:MAG: glycosyl hydrolase 115 family protein [Synergistaceae bacterium]|nr:glycosyl hydrolase 115 family protein [Synergistaceae bacterium]